MFAYTELGLSFAYHLKSHFVPKTLTRADEIFGHLKRWQQSQHRLRSTYTIIRMKKESYIPVVWEQRSKSQSHQWYACQEKVGIRGRQNGNKDTNSARARYSRICWSILLTNGLAVQFRFCGRVRGGWGSTLFGEMIDLLREEVNVVISQMSRLEAPRTLLRPTAR